ncbi:MAG: hypothetical protein AB1782_01965 [Cyanobacteriota bacterium]
MSALPPLQPGLIPTAFKKLGGKITSEPVKYAIEAIGTAGIAPLAIIMSPGPNTRKAKNEKKYQALRQIPSIVLKYGMAIIVAVLVGRRISKAAWKGYLPKGMNSKLTLKADKFKDAKELLTKIGITKPPAGLEQKIDRLQKLSGELGTTETKIRGVREAMERLLEPFDKMLAQIVKEKSITNQTKQMNRYYSKFQAKNQNILDLREKYKNLKAVAKGIKRETTTTIREIRESGILDKSQLNLFDKYVKEHAKDAFVLYRQILQALVGICTLPFSAYFLNVVYPPFVKAVAPGLAKEVEEANR